MFKYQAKLTKCYLATNVASVECLIFSYFNFNNMYYKEVKAQSCLFQNIILACNSELELVRSVDPHQLEN